MMPEAIETLLAKATQGDLEPAEARALGAACADDPALARRLARLVKIDRVLALALRDDADAFCREFRARVSSDGCADGGDFAARVARRLRRPRIARWSLGLAAAAALALLAAVLLRPSGKTVVEIVRTEACDQRLEDRAFAVGQSLTLERGLVELRYLVGVRVVLEAPAEFEITGPNRGYLHRGKLVAEVDDEKAHGFIIDGPSGRLVDLGTRFAVSVEEAGAMEVHVLEGKVDATGTSGKTSRLTKDQAMRLDEGNAFPLAADAGKFITRLPSYADQPPRFVRWSFEDAPSSRVAANSGRDLAAADADAAFRSFTGQGEGPRRIDDAPFGQGLRFDGRDAFLEAEYHGIGGGKPRTVAFWMRAPKDSGRLEGFGIINWGNVTQVGGAWQISVNTAVEDGPVGRLRIGTHEGQVIGTTELRDSEWHHCAVVMYGDEAGEPNTSTHILLYIDGQLEPTARKSVRVINTASAPDGGDHGIWMGRNLGYTRPGAPSGETYGRFYRGDIDEMIICDTALNREQIRMLMARNAMP